MRVDCETLVFGRNFCRTGVASLFKGILSASLARKQQASARPRPGLGSSRYLSARNFPTSTAAERFYWSKIRPARSTDAREHWENGVFSHHARSKGATDSHDKAASSSACPCGASFYQTREPSTRKARDPFGHAPCSAVCASVVHCRCP